MQTDPIQEARRYVDNARQTLSQNAKKEGGVYKDRKYVKTAGHQAYTGVLVALDGIMPPLKKGRKLEEWYRKNLAAMDKKLLDVFNATYETLHLYMGYDGALDAGISASGLQKADQIISWVENRLRDTKQG